MDERQAETSYILSDASYTDSSIDENQMTLEYAAEHEKKWSSSYDDSIVTEEIEEYRDDETGVVAYYVKIEGQEEPYIVFRGSDTVAPTDPDGMMDAQIGLNMRPANLDKADDMISQIIRDHPSDDGYTVTGHSKGSSEAEMGLLHPEVNHVYGFSGPEISNVMTDDERKKAKKAKNKAHFIGDSKDIIFMKGRGLGSLGTVHFYANSRFGFAAHEHDDNNLNGNKLALINGNFATGKIASYISYWDAPIIGAVIFGAGVVIGFGEFLYNIGTEIGKGLASFITNPIGTVSDVVLGGLNGLISIYDGLFGTKAELLDTIPMIEDAKTLNSDLFSNMLDSYEKAVNISAAVAFASSYEADAIGREIGLHPKDNIDTSAIEETTRFFNKKITNVTETAEKIEVFFNDMNQADADIAAQQFGGA